MSLADNAIWCEFKTTLLIDAYNDLRSNNDFEVVFVRVHEKNDGETSLHQRESHRSFEQQFSCMPWTAIPFSDITSSKSLHTSFDVFCPGQSYCTLFVIDSTGMALQCHALDIIKQYGALGYPFSDERINFLKAEDVAITNKPSLKALLGAPGRDYVISNKGEEV